MIVPGRQSDSENNNKKNTPRHRKCLGADDGGTNTRWSGGSTHPSNDAKCSSGDVCLWNRDNRTGIIATYTGRRWILRWECIPVHFQASHNSVDSWQNNGTSHRPLVTVFVDPEAIDPTATQAATVSLPAPAVVATVFTILTAAVSAATFRSACGGVAGEGYGCS